MLPAGAHHIEVSSNTHHSEGPPLNLRFDITEIARVCRIAHGTFRPEACDSQFRKTANGAVGRNALERERDRVQDPLLFRLTAPAPGGGGLVPAMKGATLGFGGHAAATRPRGPRRAFARSALWPQVGTSCAWSQAAIGSGRGALCKGWPCISARHSKRKTTSIRPLAGTGTARSPTKPSPHSSRTRIDRLFPCMA